MEELVFETNGELNAYVMDYFLEYRNVEFDEINKPMVFSVADIAKDVVDFLKTKELVFVEEDWDMCEGCDGCDQSPVEKEPDPEPEVEPEPNRFIEEETETEPTKQ